MENSKKFAEEALNGPASLRQRPHRQEGTTRDAPTALENRTDSVRPLGSSSSTVRCQLPCYQRKWIDNDDLFASIDRHGQNFAECLSLVESALAMVQCRSSPEADDI